MVVGKRSEREGNELEWTVDVGTSGTGLGGRVGISEVNGTYTGQWRAVTCEAGGMKRERGGGAVRENLNGVRNDDGAAALAGFDRRGECRRVDGHAVTAGTVIHDITYGGRGTRHGE